MIPRDAANPGCRGSSRKRFVQGTVWALIGSLVISGCAAPPTVPTPPPVPPAPTTVQGPGGTTVVSVAPAAPPQKCCPKGSIWDFLGVPQILKLGGMVLGGVRNRLGSRFPGLEAKPAVKSITDPANMSESSPPAVKAAAEAKADEDAAPQKVKAIRYLATIGCGGCYPDIEAGLLAALDDCTEVVRFEAAKALKEAAGNPCASCKATSCCSEKVLKRLDEVANKMKDDGCYVEPSARVRRMARLAMANCGGSPPPAVADEAPAEGPSGDKQEKDGEAKGEKTAAAAPSVRVAAAHGESSDAGDSPPIPPAATNLPAALPIGSGVSPTAAPVGGTSAGGTPAGEAVHAAPFHDCPSCRQRAAIGAGRSLVLARVNGDTITEEELMPEVLRRLRVEGKKGGASELTGEIRPNSPEYQAAVREALIERIDRLLVVQEAKKRLPVAEAAQVAYEAPIPASGDRLAATATREKLLADAWMAKHIRIDDRISREEIYNHYRANFSAWQTPAEVRWERLLIPAGAFESPEQSRMVARYWRERALGQKPATPQIAGLDRAKSETFDWSRPDQIPSRATSTALQSLPVGGVSPVLEDPSGVFLVRVLARRGGEVRSLDDAAPEIAQAILERRKEAAAQAYLAELRDRALVWTMFDAPESTAALP